MTRAELAQLLNDQSVTSVQEDVPAKLYLTESVPLIQADDVGATGKQGAGEVVAILDTGVRKTHLMFPGGKVASEACYSTTGPGTTSFCPGGAASSTAPGSGLNCPVEIPGCDHGTHVAGIVAGNHPSLKGVAPAARLIAIQIFSRFNNAGDCGGPAPCVMSFTTDQIKGLERVFALRNTFDIASINMSLGGGQFTSTCDANSPAQTTIITKLRNAGIATVIASGNGFLNGAVSAPSCISSAIAVGSSTKTDVVSDFSNYAPIMKLLAPGSDIRSAGAVSDNAAIFMSGTSMATPHVAGAFALMADVKEGAGVSEILSALNCTGKQIARGGLFLPRINLLAARSELLAANPARNFQFTNASDGNAFTKFVSTWAVTGGNFRSTFAGSNFGTFAALKYCSPAFRVTASIKRPAPTTDYVTGVVLLSNVVRNGATVAVSGYLFSFNSTYVWVRRFSNVALTGTVAIGNTFADSCIINKANSAATFHTIRVDAVRDVYTFVFDGAPVCTLTDTMYPPAWVGVLAGKPAGAAGHSVLVNSLVITPLSVAGPSNATAPLLSEPASSAVPVAANFTSESGANPASGPTLH